MLNTDLGGILRKGDHFIKSFSNGQSLIALLSAEALMYAILKGVHGALGYISMVRDAGITSRCNAKADASAALGISGRTGLGTLRHVDTFSLWLQEDSIKKKLK